MLKHRWNSIMNKTNKIDIINDDQDQRVYELVTRSKEYGTITKAHKLEIADHIRDTKTMPKELRRDLWMLSSGAMRTKLNNPNYYM